MAPDASLVDAHAVGGLDSWAGFDTQLRFTLLQIPKWLEDSSFVRFTPERAEDVDVEHLVGGVTRLDYFQVKTEQVTPAPFAEWVVAFHGRNRAAIESGVVRRFVVAGPYISESVRSAIRVVERARSVLFAPGEEGTQEATARNVEQRILDLGVPSSVAQFVANSVSVSSDFAGTDSDESAIRLAAANLGAVPGYENHQVAALQAAMRHLLGKVRERKRYPWSREEVDRTLREGVRAFVEGPPTPAGDLVFVRHSSLRCATQNVADVTIIEGFRDRRKRHVDLNSVAVGYADTPDVGALRAAVELVASPEVSPLRCALREEPPVELVYFGFPHVPLAVLAGYIVGQQRHLHVVEHDRDTGRFAWSDQEREVPLRAPEIVRGGGTHVRLRVSVSAHVRLELCEIGVGAVGLDIHLGIAAPVVDAVANEAIARLCVRSVRRVLAAEVCGVPEYEALHVFAAVPVSVAVLLGQALSMNSLPHAVVYNFASGRERRYAWALDLSRAERADRGVVLCSKSQGEACST
jgi:hypothetical protein